MKIALVNCRQSDSTVPPLGLLYNASSLLKAGFEVHVFDPFFNNKAFVERLRTIKPDLVGLGVLTSSYAAAKHLTALVRKALPDAKVCAGGVHVTSLPEETLVDLGLDFVVLGEGELSIVEAAARLRDRASLEGVKGVYYRDPSGAVKKNASRPFISNLDDLPYPAWHLLPMEKYLIPPGYIRSYYSRRNMVIFLTRGCPFNCIYCSSNVTFGRKIRFPSVGYAIESVERLIKTYGIDSFYFFDDTLTVDKKWIQDFCSLKLKKGINLKWGCQSRVDTINEETIRTISQAGCLQVDFGVESGSQKVLNAIRKGTSIQQTEKAFELCRKFKIRPYASIMVGNPEEEESDVFLTAELLRKIRPVYTSVCYTQPMPGSRLYDLALENKWFVNDKSYTSEEWDLRKTVEPLMTIKLSKKRQKELRSMLQNRSFIYNYFFFLSPRTIPFMFSLLFTLFLRPKIIHSIKKVIKSGKVDDFIDELLLEHRKRIMSARVSHDYEL